MVEFRYSIVLPCKYLHFFAIVTVSTSCNHFSDSILSHSWKKGRGKQENRKPSVKMFARRLFSVVGRWKMATVMEYDWMSLIVKRISHLLYTPSPPPNPQPSPLYHPQSLMKKLHPSYRTIRFIYSCSTPDSLLSFKSMLSNH